MHPSLVDSIDKIHDITKPTKTFLKTIINAFTIFRGKANYTNLSRYCYFSERTIRRWFNKGLSYLCLNSTLLRYIPSHHEKIGAIDASFIIKSGKHTDGLDLFWSGCDGKSQKGLEMSLITIVNIDANTAYGLDAKQTIVQEGKTRADLYANHIENSFDDIDKFKHEEIVDGIDIYSAEVYAVKIKKKK